MTKKGCLVFFEGCNFRDILTLQFEIEIENATECTAGTDGAIGQEILGTQHTVCNLSIFI